MALSGGKQYGLITKSKKSAPVVSRQSIFNDSSDEEESVPSLDMQKRRVAAMQTKIKKQTQLEIQRALEADPTVYEYDSIYDDMEKKKEEKTKAAKQKISDSKPKYMEALLKSAAQRKKEQERRKERKIQKEREEEGETYGDKEAYVTSAYKKKMQELAEEEERERREAEEEAANDVMKQRDMTGFYRHILAQRTGEVQIKTEEASDDEEKKDKTKEEEEQERKAVKMERHAGLNIKRRPDVPEHRPEHGRRRDSSPKDPDHRRTKDREDRDGRHRERDESSRIRSDEYSHDGRRRDKYDRKDSRHDRDRGEGRRDSDRESDRQVDRSEDTRRYRRDEGRKDRDVDRRRERSDEVDHRERKVADSNRTVDENEETLKVNADAIKEASNVNADADSDIEIDSESSDEESQETTGKPEAAAGEQTVGAGKRKEDERTEETQTSKFVKRAGAETVMSARERYLARKAARGTSKAHVSQEEED